MTVDIDDGRVITSPTALRTHRNPRIEPLPFARDEDTDSPLARYRDHPVLTRAEERILFTLLDPFPEAVTLLALVPVGALAATLALFHRAIVWRIIDYNMRLVFAVAGEHAGRSHGLTFQDLVQDGVIGLMRAVEKFDYRKGFKFSTYATWWVRQSVGRAIIEQADIVRLPVHLHDEAARVRRAADHLTAELGREPTEAEVAASLGKTERWVQQKADALRSRHVASLDQPFDNIDGERTLGDTVIHPGGDEYALTERHVIGEQVRALLDTTCNGVPVLSERHKQILSVRYGLAGEAHTLEQTGQRFGITRERARQLEKEALKLLLPYAAALGLGEM